MAKEKISNILVSVISFMVLIATVISYCPDNQICNCTTEFIKCICLEREDIIFHEDEVFMGKELIIKGCGKIKLNKLSLENLRVELVHISDVIELHIEPYAFDNSHITNFHIYNVSEFRLESFGLGNIKNTTNLIISNVTLENIVPAVLGDTGVKNLAIKNSHIGTIKSRALHLQNIEIFVMENNVINVFDTTSIAIKYIKKFSFIRNSVTSSSFGSISLASIEEADFGYCSFRYIAPSMIIPQDIDVFSFHDNHVEICDESAFWTVKPHKQIRFVNNQILEAKDDSLLPNLGPNAFDLSIIVSNNNSFVCDCKIKWLLSHKNPKYDLIRETSLCHEPSYLTDLKLSQLTMSMDEVGTCLSVEASTTTIPSTTTSSMTERKFTTQAPKTTPTGIEQYHHIEISETKTTTTTLQTKTKEYVQEQKEKYKSQNNSANIYVCSKLLSSLFLFYLLK